MLKQVILAVVRRLLVAALIAIWLTLSGCLMIAVNAPDSFFGVGSAIIDAVNPLLIVICLGAVLIVIWNVMTRWIEKTRIEAIPRNWWDYVALDWAPRRKKLRAAEQLIRRGQWQDIIRFAGPALVVLGRPAVQLLLDHILLPALKSIEHADLKTAQELSLQVRELKHNALLLESALNFLGSQLDVTTLKRLASLPDVMVTGYDQWTETQWIERAHHDDAYRMVTVKEEVRCEGMRSKEVSFRTIRTSAERYLEIDKQAESN